MKYKNPSQYDKAIVVRTTKGRIYQYFMDKEHPLADSVGKVSYHRHVMSVKIGKWIDKSYDVHHKDGVKNNNHPDNLQILSKAMHVRIHKGFRKVRTCNLCGEKYINNGKKYCSVTCYLFDSRSFEICASYLENLLWVMPTTEVAKMMNVSDKAIEKRSKILSVIKPPRGYWAKMKSIMDSKSASPIS